MQEDIIGIKSLMSKEYVNKTQLSEWKDELMVIQKIKRL